ncbi:hypothetical protein [Streptomyces sp. V4I2]|uniref:hypothetical protein n=1 Tax=Streptomyces sp. V4I2 TaxID=3042280 RepID=UPI00277EB4EA|nr:hypothetical protein [Streptomyces sp. V4I2]MDQ1047847.1 methyl-accepting chemotaxis protein [Streptomyces sp. V4I2]
MASGSDSETLEKIAELKEEISTVKTMLNSHVKPENNVTNSELTTVENNLKNKIKEGKDETKTFWQALMESVGLKDFLEAFKQKDFWVQVTLIIGALGVVIMGKLLDLGKVFNLGLQKLSQLFARSMLGRTNTQGRVLATGDSGLPQFMTRQQADSLTAVSINPHGLTQEILNGLKDALKDLVPEIQNFNNATRNMYSSGKINKLAKAIANLKGKLTPSPKQTILDVAGAVGELNTSMTNYKPEKLPKAQTFREIAAAAQDLNRNADTLRRTFVDLATASSTAAGAIGGGATAPAAR